MAVHNINIRTGWLTIAKWKFFRSRLKFDVKSLFFLSVFVVLLIAASYAAAQTGMNMNNDIYHVSVTDPNLKPILEIDQRFDVIIVNVYTASNLFKEDTDVMIRSPNVYFANTRKSASASDAIKSTLVLTSYNDINNTHPVWLTVHYLERPKSFQILSGERSVRPGT